MLVILGKDGNGSWSNSLNLGEIDKMNPGNNNPEYEQAKKIEHYSLTEIIYGSFTGAAGLLAFEKFIEGRYSLGLACASASLLTGLMTYIGHRGIIKSTKELSEITDYSRHETQFYRNMLHETLIELDSVSQENKTLLAKDLEERCESGKKGINVLPFRKVPKRAKKDNRLLTK